jgi:hypothetical protein
MTPFFVLHLLLPASSALRLEVILHTLVAALGAAMLARLFTRGRTGVVTATLSGFAFAASTAFTLHLAQGHTWIMSGAYAPWVLWAFERALRARRPWGLACLAGGLLALMIGEGGIYPAPQTAFVLVVFAVVAAIQARSKRPLACAALAGVVAGLLSGPKLLPMMEFMSRRPRLIASGEHTLLGEMVAALVSHDQALGRPTSAWEWHEFGSYVGLLQLALAGVAVAARRPRRAPLAWAGALCMVVAAGQFAPWAPWAVLHHVPLFGSMHVPTRFLFPAVLAATVLAACGVDDLARRFGRRRAAPALAAACVALAAADVAYAGRGVLHLRRPPSPWPADAPLDAKWATYRHPPCQYLPDGCEPESRYGMAEAVRRRIASIDAYEASCPRVYTALNYGRQPGLEGRDEPGYRGEVWALQGAGRVGLVGRTMNTTTVAIDTSAPTVLVFDQNGDPGWSADLGEVSTDAMNRLVWRVPATGDLQRHVLRYRPPLFGTGVACFLAGSVIVAFAGRRRSRRG